MFAQFESNSFHLINYMQTSAALSLPEIMYSTLSVADIFLEL